MLFRLHGKLLIMTLILGTISVTRGEANDNASSIGRATLGKAQGYFVPNVGQWQDDIRFMAHAGGVQSG